MVLHKNNHYFLCFFAKFVTEHEQFDEMNNIVIIMWCFNNFVMMWMNNYSGLPAHLESFNIIYFSSSDSSDDNLS